ncbi:MAG: 30S ribosome-binding factor RbfA [Deltaproteobacteria bacterium]|nr:30S ribosome-binding factor RbfA [Deltaproteobacteria bacterium]
MASQSRQERVAEAIQHEVGQMMVRGLKDPRIGLVTVTGAKVSPDLREAWIYYAVHGDTRVRQETAIGLEAAKGFVRRELGKAVRLRTTPEIHFVVDESIDRGERIEQLLREVHDHDRERVGTGEGVAAAAPSGKEGGGEG